MRKPYCLAFGLLFAACAVFAQPAGLLPAHPDLRTGQLDNGLTYYILHNEKPENRAELRLALRAGSLQEDEDQLGVAHFVEHMAFNGTEHFAKNELIDYLESTGMRFGADLNAYTSFDRTVYMLQVRTDSLPLLSEGLLVLEDWAGGILFAAEEVDKERGVVISEWRSGLSADERLQKKYFPVLYQGSRYAERLPIGDPELIMTVDYATIRRFYNDWYRPDLMAVVAVGDFDVDWMEEQIRNRFAGLRNPEAPRERQAYTVPGHTETLYAIHSDPEAVFTNVQVFTKHPGAGRPVKTEADLRDRLIRSLYNRMLNARLFEVQQQANPPFTFAFSGYGGNVGTLETYSMYAFVKEGGALPGIEAVLRETVRARQHGFFPSELERQKAELLRAAEKAYREEKNARSGDLATECVSLFLDENPLLSARQNLEIYQGLLPTITVAHINPLPTQWLTGDNRVVIVTGPDKEEVPLPTREALQTLLARMEEIKLDAYQDQVSDAPLLALKPVETTAILHEEEFPEVAVTEWTLENGVKVVLKPTEFKNDEIRMSAFSPGGHSLYPDEDYPSAGAAAALIDLSGLGELSITELQKKLAGKSVGVGPYIDERYEGINGSCSPDDLETMLQLVYLYFTQPRKDPTALQSYLSRQRSIFQNLFSDPYYYFAGEKRKIQYNDHPRRRVTTLEELDQISLERAYEIYQDRFADAGDFTFFLVGAFEPDSIQQLLTTYLGALPVAGREENWRDVGANLASGPLDTTIVRGEAPKSIVEMVFHGPFNYENGEERYHFYSLVELLRRKLRESLREDKGGVYGVRVLTLATPEPTPHYRVTISFNADPGAVDSLVQATLDVISDLKEDGVRESDLVKLRETQIQQRIESLKENSFWMGQLVTRYRYQMPLTGIQLEDYRQRVDQLDPERLQAAAQAYLNAEKRLQIILMPAEQAEE